MIRDARIVLFKDKDGKPLTYTENGEEFCAAQIEYTVGGNRCD